MSTCRTTGFEVAMSVTEQVLGCLAAWLLLGLSRFVLVLRQCGTGPESKMPLVSGDLFLPRPCRSRAEVVLSVLRPILVLSGSLKPSQVVSETFT